MSVKPSARSNSSATYWGARQIPGLFVRCTEVVSSGASAASKFGARTRPAAPAAARPATKRRRVWIHAIVGIPFLGRSRLQLALELVQEAPIGAVGDDLLRARLDHAGFMQPQRVEAHGVLGVIFAPFVVAVFAESLQRV